MVVVVVVVMMGGGEHRSLTAFDSVGSDTRFQGSTESPRPASGITPESRGVGGEGC